MFICPEIEKVGMTARQLFKAYVLESRYDTNETVIEGIGADGDSGQWNLLKRGYVRKTDTEPKWFAKPESLQTLGSFPLDGIARTVAEFGTHTGIAIIQSFTNTDAFYWNTDDVFELASSYWFTILTPDGLTFATPKATGKERGMVLKSDLVIRESDRALINKGSVINYRGESTGDILISANTQINPALITDTYKDMAVNKEIARRNYIVFNAPAVYNLLDYVTTYDGVKYVIMSGRKVQKDVYEYTAVKEVTDSRSYTGADVGFPLTAMKSAYTDNVVAETTLTDKASYVEFTGLDINTDGFYKIEFSCKKVDVNGSTLYIYFNGDTTNTNYYVRRHYVTGGGEYNQLINSPSVMGMPSIGFEFTGHIQVYFVNEKGLYEAMSTRRNSAIDLDLHQNHGMWNNPGNGSNVTSLRLHCGAGKFDIGSKFKITRVK